MLLVTHDVDERSCCRTACSCSRQPRAGGEVEVALARPRPRRATLAQPEFAALRDSALEALG